MKMTKTIAVDFDGVIHDYKLGWHDGTIYGDPVPGAMAGLSSLMARYGFAVYVHTARRPRRVARWIESRSGYGIKCAVLPWWRPWVRFHQDPGVLLVTNRKLPAVAYVDDRAVGFESWEQVLNDLTGYAARVREDPSSE